MLPFSLGGIVAAWLLQSPAYWRASLAGMRGRLRRSSAVPGLVKEAAVQLLASAESSPFRPLPGHRCTAHRGGRGSGLCLWFWAALCMAGCSLSPVNPTPNPPPPDLQSMTPIPGGPGCDAQQPGVVCSADGFCWANPRPQLDELGAVWALSPTDVWVAAGTGAVLHFDGSKWQSTAATVGLAIRGLWASAANSVWAVGERGAIRRWDGQSWRTVASGTTAGLLAVWGSGPSDVWAVGEGGTIANGNYAARIRTYPDSPLQVSGELRRQPT